MMLLSTLTIGGVTGLYDEDYLRSQDNLPEELTGIELQRAVNRRIAETSFEERDSETGERLD